MGYPKRTEECGGEEEVTRPHLSRLYMSSSFPSLVVDEITV